MRGEVRGRGGEEYFCANQAMAHSSRNSRMEHHGAQHDDPRAETHQCINETLSSRGSHGVGARVLQRLDGQLTPK